MASRLQPLERAWSEMEGSEDGTDSSSSGQLLEQEENFGGGHDDANGVTKSVCEIDDAWMRCRRYLLPTVDWDRVPEVGGAGERGSDEEGFATEEELETYLEKKHGCTLQRLVTERIEYETRAQVGAIKSTLPSPSTVSEERLDAHTRRHYLKMRLVNYLRTQAKQLNASDVELQAVADLAAADRPFWENDRWLLPVLENDTLLDPTFSFSDESDRESG